MIAALLECWPPRAMLCGDWLVGVVLVPLGRMISASGSENGYVAPEPGFRGRTLISMRLTCFHSRLAAQQTVFRKQFVQHKESMGLKAIVE